MSPLIVMQLHYLFLQNVPIGNFFLFLLTFSYILPVRETFLFNILHKLQGAGCFSQLQRLFCFYWEIYFVFSTYGYLLGYRFDASRY